MPKYEITIQATYEVEIDNFTDQIRQYITDNYEAGILPAGYENAEYAGGMITYREID